MQRTRGVMCQNEMGEVGRGQLQKVWFSSVQFSSVTQSCPTLCNPMTCSTPGLPVHHQLPESTQSHVHWVSDAIQPSHPLSSPSPPAFTLSQNQGLFKWQYAKGLTILSVLWLSWQVLCRRFTWSDWHLEIIILQHTYHFQRLLFSVSSHHEHLPVGQKGNVVWGMINLKLAFEELWLYLY